MKIGASLCAQPFGHGHWANWQFKGEWEEYSCQMQRQGPHNLWLKFKVSFGPYDCVDCVDKHCHEQAPVEKAKLPILIKNKTNWVNQKHLMLESATELGKKIGRTCLQCAQS